MFSYAKNASGLCCWQQVSQVAPLLCSEQVAPPPDDDVVDPDEDELEVELVPELPASSSSGGVVAASAFPLPPSFLPLFGGVRFVPPSLVFELLPPSFFFTEPPAPAGSAPKSGGASASEHATMTVAARKSAGRKGRILLAVHKVGHRFCVFDTNTFSPLGGALGSSVNRCVAQEKRQRTEQDRSVGVVSAVRWKRQSGCFEAHLLS
jgi:hypothetical protein